MGPGSWAGKLGFTDILGDVEAEPTQEIVLSSEEIQENCRTSLDFLAAFSMPTVFRYLFPQYYKIIWNWLLSYVHKTRDFSQLALGLPRGFAKTTFIKLFILYCILFTKKTFILVCAESQDKANNILSDVIDFLEEKNTQKVFGSWKAAAETDNLRLKKFGFRGRNIILAGATVSTVRGLNLKHQRPDVMIFEDIQSRADADSEVISKQLETDMIGTAMKAKSPHGCLFIFVGNMYPTKHSILKKLKANVNWVKLIVGGILTNGESLWEELQPKEQLIKEYENDLRMGRPEIFHAEVLNDENASINNLVDLSKIPPYEIDDNEIHQGNFVVIDPATDRPGSDSVTVTYFEVYNAVPVAREIKEGRFSPGDTIVHAITFCLRYNCRVVGIESNAYQYTLKYWFDYICLQRGIIGIDAVELYSGTFSKNARILTMFKELLTGEVKIHPIMVALVNLQITQFNPLRRDNIDGILDCLTYAKKMIELYGHLIMGGTIIIDQEAQHAHVVPALESSVF